MRSQLIKGSLYNASQRKAFRAFQYSTAQRDIRDSTSHRIHTRCICGSDLFGCKHNNQLGFSQVLKNDFDPDIAGLRSSGSLETNKSMPGMICIKVVFRNRAMLSSTAA